MPRTPPPRAHRRVGFRRLGPDRFQLRGRRRPAAGEGHEGAVRGAEDGDDDGAGEAAGPILLDGAREGALEVAAGPEAALVVLRDEPAAVDVRGDDVARRAQVEEGLRRRAAEPVVARGPPVVRERRGRGPRGLVRGLVRALRRGPVLADDLGDGPERRRRDQGRRPSQVHEDPVEKDLSLIHI